MDAFIAWALQAGAQWARMPADCTPLSGGFQLSLFGGTYRYGLAWSNPQVGIGLTGDNACMPLTVYPLAGSPADDESELGSADQEFEHAACFIQELLIAQDWVLPSWRDWVHAAWRQRGHSACAGPARRRLDAEVAAVLQRETPPHLLRQRVAAALLDHADLASLLAILAPRGALEDADAGLALLRQPDVACQALWAPVSPTERAFLPWVLPQWVADAGVTFEQGMELLGLHAPLRSGLARMSSRYLHELAEPLLGFSQPGLARTFWLVAGDSVLQDCARQANRPYDPVLRPSVSMAQIGEAWEAWERVEPARATMFARRRPRAMV